MAKRQEHQYKGRTIRRCAMALTRRWYVVTFHPSTRLPYSESECPQFDTLAAAKQWIESNG